MKNVMFPSPRGDELFHAYGTEIEIEDLFPSPRGDELFPTSLMICSSRFEFPSPRGDELFRMAKGRAAKKSGFRPLAGMSCF